MRIVNAAFLKKETNSLPEILWDEIKAWTEHMWEIPEADHATGIIVKQ